MGWGDWIQFFDLWDESINSICQSVKFGDENFKILKKKMKQMYQDLFTVELRECPKAKASLYAKDKTNTTSRPKSPVPFAAIEIVNKNWTD